jgi:predicted nucleic acid-binding protein
MRRVFADSLYWIALSHPKDQWHSAAIQASQAIAGAEIVTTDEVVSEFLTSFRHNPALRHIAVLQVQSLFARPSITVVPQTRQGFDLGFALYQARPDKKYSLIDCISMEVMRQEGITEILTHDRDFAREGFTVLF